MRPKHRICLLLSLALGLLLISPLPAAAESFSGSPGGASVDKAKVYEAQAERFTEKQKYTAAIKAYRSAFALDPSPGYLYNIGVSYLRLGNPAEALGHFSEYLRREPKPKQSILKDLETLLAQTGKLTVEGQQRKQEVLERLCYFGVVSANCSGSPAPVASTQSSPETPPPTSAPPKPPEPSGPKVAVSPNVIDPKPPVDERPLYKKGWFWGVLVASVVVVGVSVGVGAGVYASRPHNVNPPPGYTLYKLTLGQ